MMVILFSRIIIIVVVVVIIIVVVEIVMNIIIGFNYSTFNFHEEFILLLADSVLVEHLLEDHSVPELHPLREHPVFLLVLQVDLKVDTGSSGVLSLGPDCPGVGGHRRGVAVLGEVGDETNPV